MGAAMLRCIVARSHVFFHGPDLDFKVILIIFVVIFGAGLYVFYRKTMM